MRFKREKYVSQILLSINNNEKKLIFLTGPRDGGKTTILKNIYDDHHIKQKKYYFSFDQSIVSKQFHDSVEFKKYMEIKFGIEFHTHSLLMLNEIQYSKNLIPILLELIHDPSIKTKIIATSVTDIDHQIITHNETIVDILYIYPLDFFEFLQDRGIHTQYFKLDNFSQILLQEIQPYFEEYLIWGGYPGVVMAASFEEKKSILENIVRKVFEKDAGFLFQKDTLLRFENIINTLGIISGNRFKIKHLQSDLGMNNKILVQYLSFFTANHLFFQIPHLYLNKTTEITHQKKLCCIDTGLNSMLTETYNLKLKTKNAIQNFVFQELFTNKGSTDIIRTYKKINASEIDFIIERPSGELIPICISHKDSIYPPKTTEGFLKQYGDRVKKWVKLCPLLNTYIPQGQYDLHIIPLCMTKQIYTLFTD